ncbi:PREDICTED: uncharacterized protein LOC108608926 isoform X3 [Drosophila arizonae]|uniref:Uncharacterized protein LOC108608926 isoform X3 n=1 Tax=Drosophila arizonae TaxID=7263 RepID=A0ABM1NM70_DROAR|nr:PREDICTED: uncharacterized protein LOC108608926 isoform X3 [Drosophila arizonae]
MEEYMKLVAQYKCDINSNVDESSSESDSDSYVSMGQTERGASVRETKEVNVESGKRKSGTARLPTRRPDPNVYNRNALLARENRRKKKAHMEAVEKELNETRMTNRSLLKALKKQLKRTRKLERECQFLKDTLGNYKENKNVATQLNMGISSPNNRAASPEGSLISAYSSSSSYEPPMETDSYAGFLNVDNDYQPTPAYEDESSTRFVEQSSFDLQQSQPLAIIDEHSYFNKFTEVGLYTPDCEWSPSRTPPTQLLQDDEFLFSSADTDIECIASL